MLHHAAHRHLRPTPLILLYLAAAAILAARQAMLL
eukprot:COSAG02_NODE_54038_length_298_cov_0.783920_1_plen_34_part_10